MLITVRVLALLALVVLGLVLGPASVGAHADYERSEPALNAVLPEPPDRVDVWFTQEIFKREGANFLRVFDEQDVQVSEGDGTVDDDDRTHVFVELPAGLPASRYIVRWMTTSDEDGDTDDGAFCFYAGVEPTAEQEAECAAFGEPEATPTAAAPTLIAAQPTATSVDGGGVGDDDGGTPTAAIVGGIVGGIVLVGIVVGGALVWLRRRTE